MIVAVKMMIMGPQHSYGDLANGFTLKLISCSLMACFRLRLFNDIALRAKGQSFRSLFIWPKNEYIHLILNDIQHQYADIFPSSNYPGRYWNLF